MLNLRNLNLKEKLTSIVMLVSGVALVLACVAFVVYERVTYPKTLRNQMVSLAKITSRNIAALVEYGGDVQQAQVADYLEAFREELQIVAVGVYTTNRLLWARYPTNRAEVRWPDLRVAAPSPEPTIGHDRLVLFQPILLEAQPVGTFYLEASLDEMYARLWRYAGIACGVFLVCALVAYLVATALRRPILDPILALTAVARRVSDHEDYAVRAEKRSSDEVGVLIDTFNQMLNQIQQRDQELLRARDEAEKANRAKSDFLSFMSHELRTPLTSIIGFSEFLLGDMEKQKTPEEWVDDVQRIHNSGRLLLDLINDILDISKIEAGKMVIHVEQFDIAPLVRDIGALVKLNPGNQLEIDCAADLGTMRADPIRVRQCLLNLLTNANKFTEKGRLGVSARREIRSGEDWIVMRVTDTGIGMNAEQMAKLFRAFSQVDTSPARRRGGTGLGLVLTRHLCQMMGGDVSVQSEPGKGSTFTIELPARHGPLEDAAPTTAPGVGTPVKARILVVDDDPEVHRLLQHTIGKAGYQLTFARSGKEALEKAREQPPDVITLDVLMPEMDGWTVLSLLKDEPQLREIPVIMLTVRPDQDFGFAMGVADYLQKPIEKERLMAALAKVCRRPATRDVLVVEDDPAMRQFLRRLLEQEQWAVAEAENGQQALERLSQAVPALIILDLLMPVMDGFQFVEALRQQELWRRIPVIVVSAKEITPGDRERLDGHVARILEKGAFTREKLLAEVNDVVAQLLGTT